MHRCISILCLVVLIVLQQTQAYELVKQDELNDIFKKVHQTRIQSQTNSKKLDALNGYDQTLNLNYKTNINTHDPQILFHNQHNIMNNVHKLSSSVRKISNFASTAIQVAQLLAGRYANVSDPLGSIQQLKAPFKFCPFNNITIEQCDPNFPYRRLDGTCNNLQKPWLGRKEMPYKRFLDPDYADGINEPKVAQDGTELPNARDIACSLHSDSYQVEPFITNMFMQWGQLINHDITSLSIDGNGEDSKCQPCTRSEKCFPIPINPNSATKCGSLMEHPCIEFKRSTPTFSDIECSIGRREQLNLQTPYLDGSFIYGASEEELAKLRNGSVGLGQLRMQRDYGLLPQSSEEDPSDCTEFKPTQKCFMAGDDRVNQNPALMSMHTVFLREHNRIASILSGLNPSWSDRVIFEEARRVVVGIFQHITYNEYVPLLLGRNLAKEFGLLPAKDLEQTLIYDPSTDPRVSNEWTAAAGRFGHSMIRGLYSRLDKNFTNAGLNPIHLRTAYFRANSLYDKCQGGMEALVRGLLKDPIMKIDRFFTQDISQHLFARTDKLGRPFHFDLVSINIQRGRDHGIPSYNRYREFCHLPVIRSWAELSVVMPEDVVTIFRGLYKDVNDVELFSASVAEFKHPNALVGPTLACLLGIQFRDLKLGDRFWYETQDFPANFTPEQLREIRKITLSRLLCRNLVDTPIIQPFAMVSSDAIGNAVVNCTELDDINWSFWRA